MYGCMGVWCASPIRPYTHTPIHLFHTMPVIGITGGIGTGKSTVTELLRELGAITFSADEASRTILMPGGEALREIAEAFGESVLLPDGSVDRAKLAEIVFSDSADRERLETITHPRILLLLRQQIDQARKQNPPDSFIVVEAP